MNRFPKFIGMLLVVALAAPALEAQTPQAQRAPQALVMSARNVTAADAASRGAARRDSTALPGDVVRYSMTFTNVTDGPIRGVKLDNPLPRGLEFVEGSARATRPDAAAEFSADGGKTFSAQPMETVMVNGQRVTRPIPAERYTHVRWVIGGTVAPRATVTAEYSTRVSTGSSSAAVATPGTQARPPRR